MRKYQVLHLLLKGRWSMKRVFRWITNWIPTYAIFPLIFSFVFNGLVYGGTKVIAGEWHHFNIESSLDTRIPFVPQFLVIYLGCYLFWIINYILIGRQDKKSMYQFFTGDFLSRCICLVIFFIVSHDKYTTGSCSRRNLELCSTLALCN